MKLKIAVFGSAFDPPHAGHMDAIAQVLTVADSVIVVPSYAHAFGKTMAPFDIRCQMLKASIAASSLPPDQVEIDPLEQAMFATAGPPIYSFDVLIELQKKHPSAELVFVIGPDNAAPRVWASFHRSRDIRARWPMFVTEERVHVRSTQLRRAVSQNKPIGASQMCTETQNIINRCKLYQDTTYAA